jgi:hypothetical protein
LLNCFLERLDAGDPPCGPEADLGAIEAIRRTVSPEHDPLVIDCRFGPNTEKVTKMFQRCVFPTQPDEWDGKIGKKTWPELDKLCAAPAPFEFPDLPLFSNVRVWINAFIPRDIIGLTLRVPAGPHAGKTMLGEPTFISDCFLTDQRGFSDRFGASSRMRQRVSVDVSREPFTLVDHTKVCDATHEVDCEDGDEECIDSGDTDRMRASVSSVAGSLGMSALRVHFESAANNPCFGGSPDIDYRGHVTIDLLVRRIDFEILVDSFPAFEMYAQVDGGSPVVLFRRPPPRGNTPGDLPGGPTRQVRGFRFF